MYSRKSSNLHERYQMPKRRQSWTTGKYEKETRTLSQDPPPSDESLLHRLSVDELEHFPLPV